jgi:large conductance mechanosensitive channel
LRAAVLQGILQSVLCPKKHSTAIFALSNPKGEVIVIKEFRDFIMRGNVLDLAVAVVIGAAFGAIITSLVNDIFTPLIGVLMGGVNFTGLALTVGEAQVLYGNFIQAIINFLIVALALFLLIKGANSVMRKKAESPAPPPVPSTEEKLLTEIRDLLKAQGRRV